jgi:hypothetical protein
MQAASPALAGPAVIFVAWASGHVGAQQPTLPHAKHALLAHSPWAWALLQKRHALAPSSVSTVAGLQGAALMLSAQAAPRRRSCTYSRLAAACCIQKTVEYITKQDGKEACFSVARSCNTNS